MAGDFMQIDLDLPDKPEVQKILDQIDVPLDVVIGRLILFWRWVERVAETSTTVTELSRAGVTCHDLGVIHDVTIRTVIRQAGGDEAFWRAVEVALWVLFEPDGVYIPGFAKRFSKSAKQRMGSRKRQTICRKRKRQSAEAAGADSVTHVTPERDMCHTSARPEKRREEDRREEKIPSPASESVQPPAVFPASEAGASRSVTSGEDSATKPDPATKPDRQRPSVFDWLTAATLADDACLAGWLTRAAASTRPKPPQGLDASEACRLRVFAAAECALEDGRDPVGLFIAIVTGTANSRGPSVTNPQTDRAAERIRRLLAPQGKPAATAIGKPVQPAKPEPTSQPPPDDEPAGVPDQAAELVKQRLARRRGELGLPTGT